MPSTRTATNSVLPVPVKKPNRARPIIEHFRTDLAEHDELMARARNAGLSVSAYLRACALGTAGPRSRPCAVDRESLAGDE